MATGVGVVGVVLVWFRGYVVPYTPTFAPRLVAASPLPDAWFHLDTADEKRREAADIGGLGSHDGGEALLGTLVEAGALVVDEDGVELDPAFEVAWTTEMMSLADASTDTLAVTVDDLLTVPVSVVDGTDGGWVVLAGAAGAAETWLSRPVAIAEIAAVRALADRVPAETARAAATPLRLFLTACPDCGTELEKSTTVSCCGGYTTPTEEPDDVLACPDCGVRLFTFTGER